MPSLFWRAMDFARTSVGRKALRYGAVSAFNVVFGQSLLLVGFVALHWSARSANLFAAAVGVLPAYLLSRRWVWQRAGRSDLWREVAPFWAITLVGLVASTAAAGAGESVAKAFTGSRSTQSLVVMAATLLAFGIVWAVKFLMFDRLFAVDDGEARKLVLSDAA
ncbi:MAG TPA: GtrA family protein [Acidimicrobiales bacterium]|nr:GtrA family protein [Acidimicrobiales bacterium]